MLPVGGHNVVVRGESLHGPDPGGFFADIQVEETVNLLLRIDLCRFLLEPADAQHFA